MRILLVLLLLMPMGVGADMITIVNPTSAVGSGPIQDAWVDGTGSSNWGHHGLLVMRYGLGRCSLIRVDSLDSYLPADIVIDSMFLFLKELYVSGAYPPLPGYMVAQVLKPWTEMGVFHDYWDYIPGEYTINEWEAHVGGYWLDDANWYCDVGAKSNLVNHWGAGFSSAFECAPDVYWFGNEIVHVEDPPSTPPAEYDSITHFSGDRVCPDTTLPWGQSIPWIYTDAPDCPQPGYCNIWSRVDLTILAQGWYDGTIENNGVLLTPYEVSGDAYLHSSNAASQMDRPLVRIFYHAGGPALVPDGWIKGVTIKGTTITTE